MEKRRKQQIMQMVEKASRSWAKNINTASDKDDIEETIEMITKALAFGIILHSGKSEPCAYIGTYLQCQNLKNSLNGQMGAINNLWYWVGYTNINTIEQIVKNKNKNLIISIPPADIEETIVNIGEIASLDIRYGNDTYGRNTYIGSFKICTLLKAKYNGKMGKSYNHWYWIGNANFQEITNLYQAYQKRCKRFRKKHIVLQNYC